MKVAAYPCQLSFARPQSMVSLLQRSSRQMRQMGTLQCKQIRSVSLHPWSHSRSSGQQSTPSLRALVAGLISSIRLLSSIACRIDATSNRSVQSEKSGCSTSLARPLPHAPNGVPNFLYLRSYSANEKLFTKACCDNDNRQVQSRYAILLRTWPVSN